MPDNFHSIITEVLETVRCKNRDYGNSFDLLADEFGDISFVIRLQDKVNRLKTLYRSGEQSLVKDESIDDTIKDIMGYCLLMLDRRIRKDRVCFTCGTLDYNLDSVTFSPKQINYCPECGRKIERGKENE